MTTMCRSLKMLNVARLNVKASQKLRPDGSPDALGEKGPLGPVGSRADLRETRGRTLRSSKPKGRSCPVNIPTLYFHFIPG